MNITKRYVHPQEQTIRGHRSGTSGRELIRKSGKLLKQRKFLARPEALVQAQADGEIGQAPPCK